MPTNNATSCNINIEEELRRLDAKGRVIDFDDQDKAEAQGATLCAVLVFATAQVAGMYLIGKEVPIWFIVMGLTVDYFYYKMMFSDPGQLPKLNSARSALTEEVADICSKMSPEYKERLFCNFCRVTKPPRSKHCHKCGYCIAKFDHHCFWIGNCVGARNHRQFLLFLAWLTIWMSLSVFYLFVHIHRKTPSIAIIILFITTAGMFLFIAPLFLGHCLAAVFDVTTCEFLKPTRLPYMPKTGPRNPYNKGLVGNLKRFFLVTSTLPREDWEPVMQ
eukprot:TRINITY_DN23104_c0_g1_i1.p1 TRINITY_DN23104_c0_g1~~TRINITY_DN23104_c0_g1_i1.p1  ORF type:complete len:275 (+),score=22.95 TRINITY_DN23104_c0_g1_i1:114-938(+)